MAKRKELKNIAQGILGFFSGWRNHIDGYLAVNKVFEFMLSKNINEITIDVFNSKITPESSLLSPMLILLNGFLNEKLEKSGFTRDDIKSLEIFVKVDFLMNQIFDSQSSSKSNILFCESKIVFREGNIYTAQMDIPCYESSSPHFEERYSLRKHNIVFIIVFLFILFSILWFLLRFVF